MNLTSKKIFQGFLNRNGYREVRISIHIKDDSFDIVTNNGELTDSELRILKGSIKAGYGVKITEHWD